nr:UpxY family transcription antiterminator [uncultured Carboxylicivirga sp.]
MEDKKNYTWYALYTKSRAEKKVLEQLTKLGITAYLPMRKMLRQWSDRKKWVEMPVISSYIFVYIPKEDYRLVFEANGVVAYVSYKGKACTIPDSDIQAMKRTIENQLNFDIETDQLKKGQTITVTSGPLQGITGEITDVKGSKKLYLRISNIGYTLVVDMADATFSKEQK